jgi:hypothetical protein
MGSSPYIERLRWGSSVKVAQQIEDEQDNEHKAEPAAAANMASVSITTATEENGKDNYKKN